MSKQHNHEALPQPGDTPPAGAKRKMREFFGMAAAVIILLAVGGALYLGISSLVSKSPAKHVSHGYTLTPPTKWTRVQPAPDGASAAFAAPAADSGTPDTVKPFIVVQSSPLSGGSQKMSFTQLANTYLSQLAQSYTDYKQLAALSVSIGATPAVLVTSSFMQNGTPVTDDTLFTVKYGNSYVVYGEALSSVWPQRSGEIKQSLLSFRP